MKLRSLAILVAGCALAGCDQEQIDRTGSAGWSKPNISPVEFQNDSGACRRQALLIPTSTSGSAGSAAERRRRYNDCMIERGWTLDPHISRDRSLDIVDCKLPSVEQVQRTTVRDCINRLGKIL